MLQKKRADSQPQMESQTHDERTATPRHCVATADTPYHEAVAAGTNSEAQQDGRQTATTM